MGYSPSAEFITTNIPAGAITATLNISSHDDTADEPHGNVIFTLLPDTTTPPRYHIGTPNTVDLKIHDNDISLTVQTLRGLGKGPEPTPTAGPDPMHLGPIPEIPRNPDTRTAHARPDPYTAPNTCAGTNAHGHSNVAVVPRERRAPGHQPHPTVYPLDTQPLRPHLSCGQSSFSSPWPWHSSCSACYAADD